ncbi:MAG: alginate lyase family protein [Verrucomicrobia bacterium]|nr:alginate lyase family protein [Verrucomicrobiota bacterium]
MSFTRRQFIRVAGLGAPAARLWGTAVASQILAGQTGRAAQPETGARGGTLLHDEATWAGFRTDLLARPDSRALLAREADHWLGQPLPSVVNKAKPAPSGDPHDYMSLPPYAWPDPKKPDGLPWITRDGEVNPEFYKYDSNALEILCTAVPRLAAHSHATGSDAHARQAGRFLRTWFLDDATRMNPHLRFAQRLPGRDRPQSGIIDTTSLVFLLDAVTRLEFSHEWTPGHLAGLKAWFSAYLDWLLSAGGSEQAAANNHGTWFDAQVVSFAVFCGRPEVARRQIEAHTTKRIATQIEPDGRQPHELARTLALTYCTYNLLAFACIARLAPSLNFDLWAFTTPDGRNLTQGLRWLLPYYSGEQAWPHRQIRPFDFTNAALVLQLASEQIREPSLLPIRNKVERHPWQRLTFSKASLAARTYSTGAP